jgi:hypothetical protein
MISKPSKPALPKKPVPKPRMKPKPQLKPKPAAKPTFEDTTGNDELFKPSDEVATKSKDEELFAPRKSSLRYVRLINIFIKNNSIILLIKIR